MAVEDKRFYQHHGVDFRHRAGGDRRPRGRPARRRGAARSPSSTSRTPTWATTDSLHPQAARGGPRLAARGPLVQGPILTAYLNTVYYGDGAYGVEAAAADLLPQERGEAHPGPGGAARGAAPVPQRLLADQRPSDALAAAQRRARRHGRTGLHHRRAGGAAKKPSCASTPARRTDHGPAPPTSSTTSTQELVDSATAPARCSRAACGSTPRSTAHAARRPRRRSRHAAGRAAPAPWSPSTRRTGYIRAMTGGLDWKTPSSTSPRRPIASSARP